MFGGLGSYIASEVSGSVRRNVTIYGLFGLAGLLFLCAAGYALSALHTVLALRYGPVAASLWIAGGLALAAIIALCTALYFKNRKRPARPIPASAAFAAAPLAAKLVTSRIGWRIAALGGIAVLGTILGRQLFSGGNDEDDLDI
jgi:hypothetical protein